MGGGVGESGVGEEKLSSSYKWSFGMLATVSVCSSLYGLRLKPTFSRLRGSEEPG